MLEKRGRGGVGGERERGKENERVSESTKQVIFHLFLPQKICVRTQRAVSIKPVQFRHNTSAYKLMNNCVSICSVVCVPQSTKNTDSQMKKKKYRPIDKVSGRIEN